MSDLHEHLLKVVPRHPFDYENFGKVDRDQVEELTGEWPMDCSTGCKHYLLLRGNIGGDWGICVNPKSHRCGLLTFEHQGCVHFEGGDNGACEHEWEPAAKGSVYRRCTNCSTYGFDEELNKQYNEEAKEVASKVTLSSDRQTEIDNLITADDRIAAIRKIRELTNLGLREAGYYWEHRKGELLSGDNTNSP